MTTASPTADTVGRPNIAFTLDGIDVMQGRDARKELPSAGPTAETAASPARARRRDRPTAPRAVVAIPARNEADRLGACLAALITQRDEVGTPLAAGDFAIVVFANDCRDGTVAEAERWARLSPHEITVVASPPPPGGGHAGWARRRAMDLAAASLETHGAAGGVVCTTDADSSVAPTWMAATLRHITGGADAVAGYIDAQPLEIVPLGPAFLARGRLEDTYLAALAEMDALCDPRPHNPWPTHRVSSGASLAVTLDAYRAIGGLPEKPLGEDIALTRRLEDSGFKVRHATDVVVTTSCRFDGRAAGGAADTMRLRHGDLEAPCDADLEPARMALRRAVLKGRLRRHVEQGCPHDARLAKRLGLPPAAMQDITSDVLFSKAWEGVEASSPRLRRGALLRPGDLPAEIACVERILARLRGRAQRRSSRTSL